MYKEIIDFLFPDYCGFCNRKIYKRYTCEICLNILEYYRGKVCFTNSEQTYYDKLVCAFPYEGLPKSKMLQFKFDGKKYISRSFGEILYLKLNKYNIDANLIVSVPISSKRCFERGYNQSEYIAKYMAELSKIKLEKNVLAKTKENRRQSELMANERIENVRNVFEVKKKELIKGKKIILVDDIYTTGATINECSKVLKEAGASEVIATTILYSSK